MSIKTKNICLIKKILRGVVDTHAHIPNMHRATLYHMLCILKVHFGTFSMVNLALKFTKSNLYTVLNAINHQTIHICICFINAHFQNCQLHHIMFVLRAV